MDIVDNGTAPEFYIDDIGFVDDLGDNCRVAYFTYARNSAGIFERIVVVKIVRPTKSLEVGKVTRLLASKSGSTTDSLQ